MANQTIRAKQKTHRRFSAMGYEILLLDYEFNSPSPTIRGIPTLCSHEGRFSRQFKLVMADFIKLKRTQAL